MNTTRLFHSMMLIASVSLAGSAHAGLLGLGGGGSAQGLLQGQAVGNFSRGIDSMGSARGNAGASVSGQSELAGQGRSGAAAVRRQLDDTRDDVAQQAASATDTATSAANAAGTTTRRGVGRIGNGVQRGNERLQGSGDADASVSGSGSGSGSGRAGAMSIRGAGASEGNVQTQANVSGRGGAASIGLAATVRGSGDVN